MIKKLLYAVAVMAGLAMPANAQQDDTQKSFMYVVKGGKVVGTYEVGKDADYITFTKPEAPQADNYVKYGTTTVEMKSAMAMSLGGYTYVFLSPEENISTDYQQIMGGETDYFMIAIPDDMVGEEINLADYVKQDDAYFQGCYMNAVRYEAYGGTTSSDFEDEGFTAGTLKVEVVDDMVSVDYSLKNTDSSKDFEVKYLGYCVSPAADNSNTFNVDDQEKKVKAAFYLDNENDAVMDFYLTNAAIESARDLEDCYQYAHIQVPYSALDGTPIDITAANAKNFKFDFIDNIQEQTYNLSNGNIGNATGTISVQIMTGNEFKINVDIKNFGTGRNFSSTYDGEFAEYDLTLANAYRLQNQDDTELNSAVASHKDGIYTIYLSAKEGVTTVAGMADADIVVEVPDAFMDGELKGFSGTEDNAKISITYDGVKYNQANCSYVDDAALALGGNAGVKIENGNIAIDFSIFNIYKYNDANLTGHFEGKVTMVE